MAENDVGKVSLGIDLDTDGIAKQAPKLEEAAAKAGRKAGEKLSEGTEKGFRKGGSKLKKNAEKAAEEAGEGAKTGIGRKSWKISDAFAKAGNKAGKSFADKAAGGIRRGQDSLVSAAKGIAGKLAGAFALKKLFDFGKESISLGSDLEEVQNVVDSTFGRGSDAQKAVDSFAQNAAAKFGLSETMAKRYAGTFGAMSKAFGFADDDAARMSTTLAGLAGDVASFYNMTQDEAYTKLKSVFTGETESLKELGVVMTQAALDQYALENGFGRTTSAMTEQEKVMLRYQFVLSKLDTAAGDFSRTADGWANQVRILKLQFDSLRASVGQGLITALTPALHALNSFMGALVKAANTFKSFVYSLFGKKSQDMTAGAAAAMSGLGAAAADAGDTASGALDGIGDSAGGAADKTTSAANAIKRALAGFDKITKLADTSSSDGSGGSGGGSGGSGGGAGGGIDTSSMLQGTEWDLSDAESPLGDALADMFKKAWEKADFTSIGNILGEKLKGALDSIPWEGIKASTAKVAKSLATFLNGFIEAEGLSTSVGNTVGEALNTAFIAVNTFVENFHWDSLGKFITSGITAAFRTFDFSQVTAFVSNAVAGIFDFGSGLLEGIDWEALPGDIAAAIGEAISGIKFDEIARSFSKLFWTAMKAAFALRDGLAGVFNGFFEAIGDYFTSHIENAKANGGTLLGGILQGITDGIKTIGTWINTNIFTPFMTGFREAFGVDFTEAVTSVFKNTWGLVGTYISDVIGGGVKQKFIDIANGAINALNDAIGTITGALSDTKAGKWLAEKLGLDSLDEIRIPLIADLDPPPGTKYEEYKKTLEDKSKKDPIQSKGEVNAEKLNDRIPSKEKLINSTADLQAYKTEKIKGLSVDSTANFTDSKRNLSAEKRTIPTWANYVSSKMNLNPAKRTIPSWANFVSRKDNLGAGNKTFGSVANFRWRSDNLGDSNKTFGSVANFKWRNDNLTKWDKTIDTVAKFTEVDTSDLRTPKIYVDAEVRSSGGHWTMAEGGVLRGGKRLPIQSFAGGGNPYGGQIFRARENGNPELVGTLKGSTAVMNNDQIVASVSHGVAQAISGVQFVSRDSFAPHLAVLGTQVASDTATLVELAKEAKEASSGGTMAEVVSILRMILTFLQTMDFDVKLDGRSVKDRIVQLINQNTRSTGICEIKV